MALQINMALQGLTTRKEVQTGAAAVNHQEAKAGAAEVNVEERAEA